MGLGQSRNHKREGQQLQMNVGSTAPQKSFASLTLGPSLAKRQSPPSMLSSHSPQPARTLFLPAEMGIGVPSSPVTPRRRNRLAASLSPRTPSPRSTDHAAGLVAPLSPLIELRSTEWCANFRPRPASKNAVVGQWSEQRRQCHATVEQGAAALEGVDSVPADPVLARLLAAQQAGQFLEARLSCLIERFPWRAPNQEPKLERHGLLQPLHLSDCGQGE
jgi:hypothetical protein